MADFAGAVDARMAGEELLEQAGAGAWHADDKDRRFRGYAAARAGLDQLLGKVASDALKLLQREGFVITDAAALQRIAGVEMLQRPLTIADIGIGAAEREVQRNPLTLGKRRFAGRRRLQKRQPRIVRDEPLDSGVVELEADIVGVKRECGLIGPARFVEPAHDGQRGGVLNQR